MAKFWKGLMQFAFIIICVGALVGILFGHPTKLPKGFDSDSYACGVDAGVEDYPFTYFVNPTPEYKHRTVCVKLCPNADTQQLDCVPNRVVQDCKKQMNVLKPEQVVLYYESFGYMGNICVPTSLQYYAGIQDLIVPSMFKRIVNDFIQSWPLIVIVSLLIIPVCSNMLKELKNNTTYLVWIFTLVTILLTGFLGAHFVQQWNFARNYDAQQAVINNFKVSEQYIYEMTNKPNEMVNFVLAITFLCAFLYGINWLYKKTEVVQDLADIFEYVEKFMKNYGALDDLKFYFIALLFIIFSLVIVSSIFLGSAFYVDRESSHTGPFEKTQINIIFSFSTILIIFLGFWIIQIINGSYQNIIFGGFRDWIHSETSEFNQINQSALNLANQVDQQNNENKAKINLKLIYQNLNLNLICQISFMLFLSPIKFTLDYIKDSLQNLLKCKANPFKSLAVLEEVLYFELQSTTENIQIPISALRTSLNIEADGKEVNAFEIVRNINDFFLTVIKLFTFLICGTMFLSLYTAITVLENHVPSLQPLIKMNIYQPFIPAVISGIIGYFISQIYFCQYSVVSCFGYFYLSLYTKKQQEFNQFQQENRDQFRNNEGGLIQAYERKSLVSRQFEKMKVQFSQLEEMMKRALEVEENNQN